MNSHFLEIIYALSMATLCFQNANGQTCTETIGQTSKCQCTYRDAQGGNPKIFDFTPLANPAGGAPA